MLSNPKTCLFYGIVIPDDKWGNIFPESDNYESSDDYEPIDELLSFINEKINGGSGDIHAVCNYFDEDDDQFQFCIIIKPKKMGQFGEYCKIGSGFLSIKDDLQNLKTEPVHIEMEECCEKLGIEKDGIGWHVTKID